MAGPPYPAFIRSTPAPPPRSRSAGFSGPSPPAGARLPRSSESFGRVARTKRSKPRLRQCGPLTGFLYFVKINVALANRGLAQVDLPPEFFAGFPADCLPACSTPASSISRPLAPPCSCALTSQLPAGTMSVGSWRPVRCPQAADPRQLTASCRHPPWLPSGLSEVCPFPCDFRFGQSTFSL